MPPLFVASSKRLVEVYGTYDFIILVRRFGQFGLQKILLSSQNFQIFGVSVLHQELCVPDGGLEIENLLLVQFHTLLCRLPECDGISPASGKSRSFMRYADTGISAGICHEGNGYRTVCLGFPIETLDSEEDIDRIIRLTLEFFSR